MVLQFVAIAKQVAQWHERLDDVGIALHTHTGDLAAFAAQITRDAGTFRE